MNGIFIQITTLHYYTQYLLYLVLIHMVIHNSFQDFKALLKN